MCQKFDRYFVLVMWWWKCSSFELLLLFFYYRFCFRFFPSFSFWIPGLLGFRKCTRSGMWVLCSFVCIYKYHSCSFILLVSGIFSFSFGILFFFSYTNERWYPCHPLTKRHRKSGTQYMSRPVLHALCFMFAVMCGFFARFPVIWWMSSLV